MRQRIFVQEGRDGTEDLPHAESFRPINSFQLSDTALAGLVRGAFWLLILVAVIHFGGIPTLYKDDAISVQRNGWKSVWTAKGETAERDFLIGGRNLTLMDLIQIDGFDSGAGNYDVKSWKGFTSSLRERLKLQRGMHLLEVGCGSGAFLLPAYQEGIKVAGIDVSEKHVRLARRVMPEGAFLVGEANDLRGLGAEGQFDAVVSHSVFHYFDTDVYAETSIQEMIRMLRPRDGACIAVMDLNDAAKKDAFLETRMKRMGGKVAYEKKYKNYPQQFYDRNSMQAQLEQAGLRVEIEDQNVAGYANSEYRFNIYGCRP